MGLAISCYADTLSLLAHALTNTSAHSVCNSSRHLSLRSVLVLSLTDEGRTFAVGDRKLASGLAALSGLPVTDIAVGDNHFLALTGKNHFDWCSLE